jgi:hypothetical protein
VARTYSDPVSTAHPSAPPSAQAPLDPPNAGFGRRLVAWMIDWALCYLITFGVLGYDLVLDPGAPRPATFLGAPQSSWVLLGLFVLENLLLVSTIGATVGHFVLGLQVWRVRAGVFPVQVLVRTLLVALVLPALVPIRDGRCLHDVAAGTRLVRRPR